MFMLFGWGFKTNKVFDNKNEKCSVCANEGKIYIRSRTWFTLFFIPIIPYMTQYLKVCQHCKSVLYLKKPQFFLEIEDDSQPSTQPFPDFAKEDALKNSLDSQQADANVVSE